jgi:hypothetical protein
MYDNCEFLIFFHILSTVSCIMERNVYIHKEGIEPSEFASDYGLNG